MAVQRFLPALGLLALLAWPAATRAEENLSYRDLVQRMTDLSRPARLPAAGETCQQWSSYDRASRYDEATGKYLHWDANGDGNGVIRTEGDQIVMAEMDGPGCIWRIWSAAAEKGHVKIKNDRGTLYALTAQWYLAPDGVDPYGPVPVAQRDGYYVKPEPIYAGIRVLNEPAGSVERQELGNRGPGKWKNDEQLWWTGARPKDKLVLALPVTAAGPCEVMVHLTKAIDYGIVQFSVDDRKAGEPIDLFHDGVVPTGPLSLGTFDLSAGQHRLTVEIVGANPQAQKSYMFGIDRIELKPVR